MDSKEVLESVEETKEDKVEKIVEETQKVEEVGAELVTNEMEVSKPINNPFFVSTSNNGKLYNVALFIDYENVYKNLLGEEKNTIRDAFFEKIRIWSKRQNRRLVKIAVYCNYDNEDLHESYHQSLLQSYGVETIHTSNQGKNYADLQLTIDVLNAMHLNDNIDEFIIMSNDKDMTPLLNNIRYNKKKVSIITTGDKYNQALCSFADEQIKYEDIVSINVEDSFIDKVQEQIVANIENYALKVYDNYIEDKNNAVSNLRYKHIEFEYYVSTLVKRFNIMKYEVLNCLNYAYKENKIFLYTYTFKGKTYWGISSIEQKDKLLTEGIIDTTNIMEYDFSKAISDMYKKYTND